MLAPSILYHISFSKIYLCSNFINKKISYAEILYDQSILENMLWWHKLG